MNCSNTAWGIKVNTKRASDPRAILTSQYSTMNIDFCPSKYSWFAWILTLMISSLSFKTLIQNRNSFIINRELCNEVHSGNNCIEYGFSHKYGSYRINIVLLTDFTTLLSSLCKSPTYISPPYRRPEQDILAWLPYKISALGSERRIFIRKYLTRKPKRRCHLPVQ